MKGWMLAKWAKVFAIRKLNFHSMNGSLRHLHFVCQTKGIYHEAEARIVEIRLKQKLTLESHFATL